jgi:hypothetical protein
MTALEQLNGYVRQVERRLRLFAASRGFAFVAGLALALTVVLVAICNRFQFAQDVVLPLRILLLLAVASIVSFGLAIPLWKITRKRAAHIAEQSVPEFQERLLTVTEHPDPANPFTELVAEDALQVAREHSLDQVKPASWLWMLGGAGAVAAAILLWLIAAGPGYWGYGASLLWTGSAHAKQRPLYEVLVQPGDKTIRRKSDLPINAQLIGFSTHRVLLHARYGASAKWEEAAMQPAADSDRYQFVFPAVSDSVEYYVQADSARSKHFKISVKDLPAVKRLRVLLRYPSGLGLRDVSQDPGGDIRAVQGTRAEVSVLTDRRLEHGVLALDNGQKIELANGDGNWTKAELPIAKDGAYHIAAIDGGETIRISEDYFIEAKKDEAPSVRITRPGHDPRVSPIEEMPVVVEAADDFGVKSLELHYSVNGGDEQVARFKSKRGKDEQGHTTLYLENFKLAPGDVISMYGVASDANQTTRSDLLFAQAEAFDYKFSQSQQSGGMGGGGSMGDNSNISERQKQIIAATFNELRGESKSKSSIQEQARFLSDMEGKLGAQAKTLADRMGNRELSQANPEFEKFSKLMTFASSEMGEAVDQLQPGKWKGALVPEQKALQSLLRAEAIFRDIQVAFGPQNGGGAGGGMQRELARMFDLELDTSKNQYETGQQQNDTASEQQKAIDAAFERLQMLARRQQELAQQHSQQQPAEQRWQEEQLRREAEELRRQMEQLASNSQNGQQQSQSQNGQQSSSGSQSGRQSASSEGRQGGQQGNEVNQAMRHASEALKQAEDEMRNAVGNGDAAAQQRAAGQLAEAQRQLSAALHRSAGNSLSDLSQQADSLAQQQRDVSNHMKQMYRQQPGANGANELSSILGESGEMPEMNDPEFPRFGYGYRRRNRPQELRPMYRPTEEEKALAAQKEKLARQLEELQRGMEQQQQNLQATAPDAANKVRRALSDAEQKELALRMQKNAQWIREGYGDRNLAMEDNVTAGVEQLSRDLQGAQQALGADQQNGQGKQSDKTAQALAQVRQLREMLERAQQGKNGQPGGQQAGSQQGQNGQQPGSQGQGSQQQAGSQGQGSQQQAGSQQQSGSQAQPGASGGGPTEGTLTRGYAEGSIDRRDLQEAIGQLSALRGQISGQDRALGNYFGGTLGYLRDLNADPSVLQATIGQDAVASLERLEAELSRRLGEQQAQGARSGAPEVAAEKYRQAVAEYFKKLSQVK